MSVFCDLPACPACLSYGQFSHFMSIIDYREFGCQYPWSQLATCINYADVNNSTMHMCGFVSAGFLRRDVLLL